MSHNMSMPERYILSLCLAVFNQLVSALKLEIVIFKSLCAQVSGLPIAEVMDTWTKQMGYPVLDLSVSETSAKLSQKRFVLDPKTDANQPPSPFG